MTRRIQREFENFSKFIANIRSTDLSSYRDELYQKINNINNLIESSDNKEELKNEFFKLFETFDCSPIHSRARSKPLGYAGDFLLIDWIYTQRTASSGMGKLFDLLFHSYEATQAVRNRKDYFIKKCIELSHQTKSRFDVLNIGCGPCRDVIETYQTSNNGDNLYFHCIDHEAKAIQYAKNLLIELEGFKNIHLECANIFKYKSTRKYDLIWSAGLFDYLDERMSRILIRKLWRLLKKNGQIIFGNFSPKNPTRRGMELGCRWYLIHRNSQDLISLCESARIQFSEIEIEGEPLGINLFCIIKK